MPRKVKSDNDNLEMIVTIVSKGKGNYFLKLYDSIGCSLQTSMFGMGTADSLMMDLFGLADIEKDVVVSLLTKTSKDKVFSILDNELEARGKGIAFSVPLSGLVGKTLYMFLINQRGDQNGN